MRVLEMFLAVVLVVLAFVLGGMTVSLVMQHIGR